MYLSESDFLSTSKSLWFLAVNNINNIFSDWLYHGNEQSPEPHFTTNYQGSPECYTKSYTMDMCYHVIALDNEQNRVSPQRQGYRIVIVGQ